MNVVPGETSLHVAQHSNLSEDEILQEMQEEALHASARQAASAPAVPSPAAAAAVAPATWPEAHLATLLALDGPTFVETAFNALLRRPVDAHGLTYFAGQLATNARSKVEILGSLRYSREGRKIKVKVPGLLSRYVLLRSRKLPGIGRLIDRVSGPILAPRQIRRLRADMLNDMAALRDTTHRLHGAIAHVDQRVAHLQAEAPSRPVETSLQRVDGRLQDIDARLAALSMENWAEPLIALAAQMDEHTQRTRRLEAQSNDIVAVGAVLRGLRAEHGWSDEDAASFAARLTALSRDVMRRSAQAEETAESTRLELLDQSRRLGLLLADVRRRMDAPFAPDELVRLEAADDHRLDSLYVAFEDRFRGSRADIRERQRALLPLLRDANAGGKDRPIVDVGAGRGEWLELLRDEELQATGVDMNHSMVELCRGLGLDCVEDDAISYLRQQPDNSLGAVTGFHIIEHLPFKAFVALLDESLRVLKPHGLILFETPNPANLQVGSRFFYLDPTHHNPMPGEMTSMIAEARGFVQVQIRELHPAKQRFQARDEILAAQLDRLFHGPQDYALVARKA